MGYRFINEALFLQALTHGSFSHENLLILEGQRGIAADYDYERLEFLGDSVLKLIISTQLYKEHPSWAEGHLSQARQAYERNSNLIKWTMAKGIDKYVRHGVGIGKDESGRNNIYSNVFESILGAIFVDCNYVLNV